MSFPPLDFRTNNVIKARLTTKGQIELINPGYNTFIGEGAGNSTVPSAIKNTANGYQAMYNNLTGDNNVVNGYQALFNATDANNTNFLLIRVSSCYLAIFL